MTKTIDNREKGAALLLSIILILLVSLIIGSGLSSLALNGLINTQNKVKSVQSYYAAEAGIEDSLLRLKNNMQFFSPNTLIIENSSASIEISGVIGGSRTITSQGDTDSRIKKLSVVYLITTDEISFYYGAQAGEGGIIMGNNSRIEGNVFSNGSILPSGGGTSEITDTVIVAGNGNKIEKINIGGDAYVHSCKNSDINGTLHYVSGGSIENCTYTNAEDTGPNEIEIGDMPVSDEQINDWKDEISTNGTLSGDYIISSGEVISLGPIKITGQLILENNSTLNLTGSIYVTGNILVKNGSILKLNNNFGSISGMIISDGKINIRNGVSIQGSGAEGSFLMLLSTNDSLDPASPAVNISNTSQGAIFYASNGIIHLHNNVDIREATGYMLALDNNAVISYESGLENANFNTGSGGSWQVKDWKEIE